MYVTSTLSLTLNGSAKALLSSGYICLVASWVSETSLSYYLVNIPSGSFNTTSMRNIESKPLFPIGFITVSNNVITKIENYYPSVAVIIEAAVCTEDEE